MRAHLGGSRRRRWPDASRRMPARGEGRVEKGRIGGVCAAHGCPHLAVRVGEDGIAAGNGLVNDSMPLVDAGSLQLRHHPLDQRWRQRRKDDGGVGKGETA